MNKKLLIVISVVVLVLVSALLSNLGESSSAEGNVNFKVLAYGDYAELIKTENQSIIYVGADGCGYCGLFEPTLKQVMEELDLTVNYLNISSLTEDEYKAFRASDDFLTNERWGTPLILIWEQGELKTYHSGNADYETVITFFNNI